MLLQVLLDLAIFCALIPGLGLFIDRRIRDWEPLERLCAVAGLSFALAGAFAFLIYLTHLPRQCFLLLPAVGLAQVFNQWRKQGGTSLLSKPEVREAGLAWIILVCWCLGLLSLVVNYSGGGWAGDWIEHYHRTRFFLDHLPLNTLFLDTYAVTARPPLANLATGACLGISGVSFANYQVFTTLFASLAFLPALLLATRFAKTRSAALPAILVLLCMVSPFFIQNATFAWTKLPAAFFILSGLAFLHRSLNPGSDRARARTGWTLLALGMLVHYSAGPWIMGAIAGVAAARFFELRKASFWREQMISAAFSLLVLSPWLLWALVNFGTKTSFSSNSSLRAFNRNCLGEQLAIVGNNFFDTIVPFFCRAYEGSVIAQASGAGALRDFFFSLYQVNLLFIFGSAGGAACAWIVLRRWRSIGGSRGRFWPVVAITAIAAGIVSCSFPDSYGLAHICLQSLALLGLALLAAEWDSIRGCWRTLVCSLIAADFVLGICLHFGLQSFIINRWLEPGLSNLEYAFSMGLGSQINYPYKLKTGEPFLGDNSTADHWGVVVALALLLCMTLRWAWLRSKPAIVSDATDRLAANEPSSTWNFMGWRISVRAILALASIIAVASASWMLNSTFMTYDDEGYVLFSLKNFSEHGGLYEKVFSQYGPFYFLLNHALHLCGLEFSNGTARFLNLIYWTGCAFFGAAAVWRLSRKNLAATVFTLCSTIFYLWPMISEPSHPGAFIAFTVAGLAWLGCRCQAHPAFLAAAAGIAGAVLLLTKINVGIFLLAGAGAWMVLHSDASRRWPLLRWSVMALFLAIPWVLMRTLLHESWVLTFAWVVTMGGAGVFVACSVGGKAVCPPKALLWMGVSFAATASITLLLVHLRHTSWSALLDGMILAPLQMPSLYTSPVKWRVGTSALAALSLILAVIAARSPSGSRAALVLPLRLLAACVFILCWCEIIPVNIHALVMSY
ncbi:MAG: hypothetical protein WC378_12235, partial [Opitutaceae bacterium]